MIKAPQVRVIGAGLAGSEAAHFLAEQGLTVELCEMRPKKMTEAHHTANFAELVCSNSFKSLREDSAPGMLKAEMRRLGSLVLKCAQQAAVPAGEALGVDRDLFSAAITQTLREHPRVSVVENEITDPWQDRERSAGPVLIATGPLTAEPLGHWLQEHTGKDGLYFYDAIAPIIDTASLDMDKIFAANRYDKGEDVAYLNCPFDETEYNTFLDQLLRGEKVTPKNFEKEILFQGCQPIESIAATGRNSLRFGPMKPVGLRNPRTGQIPYAAVQLRPENKDRTCYNLVGFQTKLKYADQARVFRLIPGLEKAEFLRLGSMHRNTYINAPSSLNPSLSLKTDSAVYVAGQVAGVEGYLESAACGLMASLYILKDLGLLHFDRLPERSALAGLYRHLTESDPKNYQPSNIHFGLFPHRLFDLPHRLHKNAIRQHIAQYAIDSFTTWWPNALQSQSAPSISVTPSV